MLVTQGSEPPAFYQLFNDEMVVNLGRSVLIIYYSNYTWSMGTLHRLFRTKCNPSVLENYQNVDKSESDKSLDLDLDDRRSLR